MSSQSSLRSHGSPNAYPVELDDVYREVPRVKGTSSNGSGSGNTSAAAAPTSGKDSLCQECKKSFRDLKYEAFLFFSFYFPFFPQAD